MKLLVLLTLAVLALSLLVEADEVQQIRRGGRRLVRVRGPARRAGRNFGRRVVSRRPVARQQLPRQPLAVQIFEVPQPVRSVETGYQAAEAAAPVVSVAPASNYEAAEASAPVVSAAPASNYAAAAASAPVVTREEAPASDYVSAEASAPIESSYVAAEAAAPAVSYSRPVQRAQPVRSAYVSAPAPVVSEPVPAPSVRTTYTAAPAPVVVSVPEPARYAARSSPVLASAASTRSETKTAAKPIAILRSINNAPGTEGFERTYNYEFESENGISQEASGELRIVDKSEVMVMRGSYSYLDAEGNTILVSWIADENGFRAESSALPVAPAIPFEEQRIAVEAQIAFAEEQRANGITFDAQPSEVVEVIDARDAPLASYSS